MAIKSGEGDIDDKRFFALTSSLFAIKENMPTVPNTPEDIDEIVHEVESLNAKNNYLDFLSNIKAITKMEEDEENKGKNEYCVLSLNYQNQHLTIKRFKSSEIEQANEYYTSLESLNSNNKEDSVLVRVSSFAVLKKAYPNYFADISEFVYMIKRYLK